MIREGSKRDDPCSRIFQSSAERFRVADTAETGDIRSGQQIHSFRRLLPTQHLQGAMARLRDNCLRRPMLDLLAQIRFGRGIHLVASSQDYRIGASQAPGRFAQQAAWKNAASSPGIRGVEKHDVEHALQATVLKAVVQHQDFALQFFDRNPCQLHPVSALEMRHVGQRFFQEEGFVVGPCFRAESSTQDGDDQALLSVKPADIFHAGRFSRTSQRQVANADHWNSGLMKRTPVPVVESIAAGDDEAINPADQIEASSL